MNISPVFRRILSTNRGPVLGIPTQRHSPDYRVEAFYENGIITLSLVFCEGVAYCCSEIECHLPMKGRKQWDRIRNELQIYDFTPPFPLHVQIHVEIEHGALFFDFSRPDPALRGWYEFKPAQAARYFCEYVEEAPQF
ncbi:hypothetical protein GC163_21600 [bacterium]|nr:hypothetical protein [bacterium]